MGGKEGKGHSLTDYNVWILKSIVWNIGVWTNHRGLLSGMGTREAGTSLVTLRNVTGPSLLSQQAEVFSFTVLLTHTDTPLLYKILL